jgi:hypothetical protein
VFALDLMSTYDNQGLFASPSWLSHLPFQLQVCIFPREQIPVKNMSLMLIQLTESAARKKQMERESTYSVASPFWLFSVPYFALSSEVQELSLCVT